MPIMVATNRNFIGWILRKIGDCGGERAQSGKTTSPQEQACSTAMCASDFPTIDRDERLRRLRYPARIQVLVEIASTRANTRIS
jgi:hypothetical protein